MGTSLAHKRISWEYAALMKEPMGSLTAGPVGDDLFRWRATLNGPEGSVYQGGVFALDVEFPKDYPFRPPKVRFVTKVFHPNLSSDGCICMDMLLGKWAPQCPSPQCCFLFFPC
jgi:ubiquitin-conjugating enzyme E2 D/E